MKIEIQNRNCTPNRTSLGVATARIDNNLNLAADFIVPMQLCLFLVWGRFGWLAVADVFVSVWLGQVWLVG